MHLRYIHWFNNQGSNAVLKAGGYVSDSEVEKTKASLLAAIAMKLISKTHSDV